MKIGYLNFLTILLVILRLGNVIVWPWWIILAPTILGMILWITLFLLIMWLDSKYPGWRIWLKYKNRL